MANQTFNKIKIFFNKKPVRIIIALLVIAAIMTGVSFAIIALLHAISPKASKCQHDTIEINGKCYNSICQNSCSEVVGQHRDLSTPPLCPCICEPGQKIAPNEEGNEQCVNTCGPSNELCNDPSNPKSCVWVNYRLDSAENTLACRNNLTGYIICDSLPENNNHYVACDQNNICSIDEGSNTTYCYNIEDPSKGSMCEVGKVNPCTSDIECTNVYNSHPQNTTCIFDEDWKVAKKIGYCSTGSHSKDEQQINKGRFTDYRNLCADKNHISKDNSGNFIICAYTPCNVSDTNCRDNHGCCPNDICKKSGGCLGPKQGCAGDSTVCDNDKLYDCSDYEHKTNCKYCCTSQSHNNMCFNTCEYKSDIGTTTENCSKDEDCGYSEISNFYKDPNVGGICVNGTCKLGCGPYSAREGGPYSCENFSYPEPSQNVSHCYKKDICTWGLPTSANPAEGTWGIPEQNKIICNKLNSGGNYWRPESGQSEANYYRTLRSNLKRNPQYNQEAICNKFDFLSYKRNNSHDATLNSFTDVESVDYTSTHEGIYGTLKINCNQSNEYHNTDYTYNTDNTNNTDNTEFFENLNKIEDDGPVPWTSGKFLPEQYIAPIWNEKGYYNIGSSHEKCLDPFDTSRKFTPENCKYLENSHYCSNGSFDGVNCITKSQREDTSGITSVCAVNEGTTPYPNDIICNMPSEIQPRMEYKCPTYPSTGFDSCCGKGVITTTPNQDTKQLDPNCQCTYGFTKDSNNKCSIVSTTNLLQLNQKLIPCLGSNVHGHLKTCTNSQGHGGEHTQIFFDERNPTDENNIIVILKKKGTGPGEGYLNLGQVTSDFQALKVVNSEEKLNFFYRTAVKDNWGGEGGDTDPDDKIAGYNFCCLAYYDKNTNDYNKILTGLAGSFSDYAVTDSNNQDKGSQYVKTVILANTNVNEFMLYAVHINTKSGGTEDNPHIWVAPNPRCGKQEDRNTLMFDSDCNWDGTNTNPPDDSYYTAFEIVLALSTDGRDDFMLHALENPPYSTIQELFNDQFINNNGNVRTIKQLLNLFNIDS